jgi:uncharacterized membrane protein
MRASPSGRRFGVEIGLLCVALALLVGRHGEHPIARVVPLLFGAALLLVALLRPATLVPLARRWTRIGDAIARVTTPLVLALVYVVVVTPMALLRRTLGRSPIARDRAASSYWVRRAARTTDRRRADMERQF